MERDIGVIIGPTIWILWNRIYLFIRKKRRNFYMRMLHICIHRQKRQIFPRKRRYVCTEKGIRQYAFLKDNVDTSKEENRYLKDQKGQIVRTNLMTKLFTIIVK